MTETRKTKAVAGPQYARRVRAVREAMAARGIDCLLVCGRENVRYLFGFTGSSGWAILNPDGASFLTDARYDAQAHAEVVDCDVCISPGRLSEAAAQQLQRCGSVSVGFEADSITVATLNALEKALREAAPDIVLVPVQQMVESVRSVKEEHEIQAIAAASELVDGALEHARATIGPGLTERALAWEIERWLREHGSEPVPFPLIVAAGHRSALPHATPGDHEISRGEPVLIDIGAVVDGYCSDLSRTLFLGQMTGEIEKIYHTVLNAQVTAVNAVRAGMTAVEADGLARTVIEGAGYGDRFGHGLGHGVGLVIHERPTVSRLSRDVLKDDMVFTIEPGIYVPGLGGVRIEDTVVLRNSKAQLLTRTDKRSPVCATRPSG